LLLGLLFGNIQTTDYFKNLSEIKTFNDYVDQVSHCFTILSCLEKRAFAASRAV